MVSGRNYGGNQWKMSFLSSRICRQDVSLVAGRMTPFVTSWCPHTSSQLLRERLLLEMCWLKLTRELVIARNVEEAARFAQWFVFLLARREERVRSVSLAKKKITENETRRCSWREALLSLWVGGTLGKFVTPQTRGQKWTACKKLGPFLVVSKSTAVPSGGYQSVVKLSGDTVDDEVLSDLQVREWRISGVYARVCIGRELYEFLLDTGPEIYVMYMAGYGRFRDVSLRNIEV